MSHSFVVSFPRFFNVEFARNVPKLQKRARCEAGGFQSISPKN